MATNKKIQSMFCPFCDAPLIDVQKEFDNLGAALSFLVEKYGSDILKDKQNTMRFLEEFFQAGNCE